MGPKWTWLAIFFCIGTLISALVTGNGIQANAVADSFNELGDAAGALAATFETAGRGVIYEHAPQGSPAQALAAEIKTALAGLTGKEGR